MLSKLFIVITSVTIFTFSFCGDYHRQYVLGMAVSNDGNYAYSIEVNDVMYLNDETKHEKAVIKLKCLNLETYSQEWESEIPVKKGMIDTYAIKEVKVNPQNDELMFLFRVSEQVGPNIWDIATSQYFGIYSISEKKWKIELFDNSEIITVNGQGRFEYSKDGNSIFFIGRAPEYEFIYNYDHKGKKILNKIKLTRSNIPFAVNKSNGDFYTGTKGLTQFKSDFSGKVHTYPKTKDKLMFLEVAADKDIMVAGKNNNFVNGRSFEFWKTGDKAPLKTIEISDLPMAVDLSLEKNLAAVFLDMQYTKGRLEVYDLNTGILKYRIKNQSFAYDLAFRNNKLIMSSAIGVNVFDLETGKFVFHRKTNEKDLISCSDDVTVYENHVVKLENGYKVGYENNPHWAYFDQESDGKWICTKAEGAFADNFVGCELTVLGNDGFKLFFPKAPEGQNTSNLTRNE